MTYLYRFDNLEDLIKQQRDNDAVLRGRRLTGTEKSYPHCQIKQEMESVSEGCAVYRLSFWKNADAMLRNLDLCPPGSVIQRVSEKHCIFEKFKKDDDEYLKEYAWIFWVSMEIVKQNPGWSPVGIEHEDIEVLTLDGSWIKLSELLTMPSNDWRLFSYPNVRLKKVEDDIFIRGASDSPHLITNQDLLLKLIGITAPSYQPIDKLNWYYSYEMNDKVMAYEFTVGQSYQSQNFLQKLWGAIKRNKPTPIFSISNPIELENEDTEKLYERFGNKFYSVRGASWKYLSKEFLKKVV